MRLRLLTSAMLVLLWSGTVSAQEAHRPAAATGDRATPVAAPAGWMSVSTPILRQIISVDLQNASFADALAQVSSQLGGRLMYDEAVSAVERRVTLRERDMRADRVLEHLLEGSGLEMVVPEGGSLVLLKRAAPAPEPEVVDSARVRGRVLDAGSGEPIPMVTVKLDGGAQALPTNEAGIFAFARVPAGRRVISFERIGYRTQTLTLNLREGQDTTFVVQLSVAPYMLSELVTTGSGERRRMEVGNAAVRVNVDSIMAVAPVMKTSELIAQRIPGLVAQATSGAAGAPTRLRIRGTSSIESNNEPIIIIDGIRMVNDAGGKINNSIYGGVWGGNAQAGANDLSMRLDDIDPNTIESIEVLKGPAASTLYGSEAGNGVIVIKTKRGSEGKPLWSMHADYALTKQPTDYDYPKLQAGYSLEGGGSQNPGCTLGGLAAGTCVPIEGDIVGFNMMEDPRFNPTATGHTRNIGVSVSGGTGTIGYYLAGSWLDQLGTAKLPEINQQWIKRARGWESLPEEVVRPNARTNASVTSRFDVRLGPTADISLGAKFISQTQRVGNDGMAGLMAQPRYPTDTLPVFSGWQGWYGTRQQDLKHIIGNSSANWRPRWYGRDIFTLNFTYGWDLTFNTDEFYAPKNSCFPLCQGTSDQGINGYINKGNRRSLMQTLNLGMAVNLPVASWVSSTTRLGGNYQNRNWAELYGAVDKLAIGRKFRGASGTARINEIGEERAMAGWYLEQQFNMREDRLFVTFGLRQDAGSTIGETKRPIYPKAHFSWVLSDEEFFPLKNVVSLFRVRGATGDAGVMPHTTAQNRSYSMANNFVLDNGSPTGFFAKFGSPGNPWLDPERSREFEGGFDLEMLDGRLAMDFTAFRKYTWGAIHRSPVSGSLGPGVTTPVVGNFGDVRNQGFELSATLQVVERDNFSYSLVGNLSSRDNKVTKLDDGIITFSSLSASGDVSGTIKEGYPLFANWTYPILGWRDRDGNGFIDADEVMVGDSVMYVGPTQPKYTAYMGHYLSFLDNRLSVNANFAYSSGQSLYNTARKDLVASMGAGSVDKMSLRDQACYAATQYVSGRQYSYECYMETVKVLRLQDVTVSYTLPQVFAQRIGATAASVRVTGRNLFMSSNFKGRDPGINTEPVTGNAVTAGAAFGAPREYGLGIQLSF